MQPSTEDNNILLVAEAKKMVDNLLRISTHRVVAAVSFYNSMQPAKLNGS